MSEFGPQVASCLQIQPEEIEDMLLQFRDPMISIRTREMVLERWPSMDPEVWYVHDEWTRSQPDPGNFSGLPMPTQRWSSITECAVPREAEDADLEAIRGDAERTASYEYSRLHTRLASLLYPDSLLDIANAVDRFNEFKTQFDDFVERQEDSGFKQIDDLFANWSGGTDNYEAFLAFGHTKDTAGTQRSFLREFIQVTIAEFTVQAEVRNNIGERLFSLMKKLEEAQNERGYALTMAYAAASSFTPLGYLDGVLTSIEALTLESGGENSWFADFKEKFLIGESEVGIQPDTFDLLIEGMNDMFESIDNTLTEARSEISSFAEDINSDYSGLIQGEAY